VVKPLSAALIAGGLATLIFGSFVPLWLAAPVVLLCAIGIAFVLSPRLAKPLNEQIAREREFSSNASHQLRTPMTAMRLRLEDMTMWPDTTDELRDELNACIKEVDRLNGTVEDLLSIVRDGTEASSSRVDLADAAASAVSRWRRLFGEADRTLAFSASPEPVLVATAPRPMLQVIDVLLENALVHGNGATSVLVDTAATRGLIVISDEGALSPIVADHLFDRSFRSATSAGSGIGLALARTIVDSCGGRLRVASTTPTQFELSFRLA
jgi:signal transduction histidine kinase